MHVQVDITLAGMEGVPLLTHNERLASPLDPIAKAMKAISSKRMKTEDDLNELARLEFEGGLYETGSGKVGIPAWNVFRSLQDGAKLNRLGKAVERGLTILSPDIVPLTHNGPDTATKMWAEGLFDQRSVKVGTSKVTRTRPVFKKWATSVQFLVDLEVIDMDLLRMVADRAGLVAGLGDYRPRFGRYEAIITELEGSAATAMNLVGE
jgi:hypothetical protein